MVSSVMKAKGWDVCTQMAPRQTHQTGSILKIGTQFINKLGLQFISAT